jgi:hypothetical protein
MQDLYNEAYQDGYEKAVSDMATLILGMTRIGKCDMLHSDVIAIKQLLLKDMNDAKNSETN